MAHKKTNIHYPLYPLSILYGMGVRFRNLLFDRGILKTRTFTVPIICVGNLTVGGTGKTPHIEYLIRLLSPHYRIAVLSRGYKRKSKGFLLATAGITPGLLGDEPYQLWCKFPDLQVAVDSDRCHGIDQLLSQSQPPQVILLDDAYQHRYVKAGLNLLLTDYNRPFYTDALLPAGRLREGGSGKERADIFIVSKSPQTLSENEVKKIEGNISPTSKQKIFFSGLAYQPLRHVFTDIEMRLPNETHVLLVTGIARPELVENQIKATYQLNESLVYPDHHDFTETDIIKINHKFNSIKNKEKAIVVTEKDAVRLRHNPFLNDSLKENMYFLPLEIVFLHNETNRF
ncbi:MAG: tetraacyldisaccharide 4'-kinase, partial [Bacteroidales bacterium]